MSIYSGFATRFLETKYNNLVCKVIELLHSHVYKTFLEVPFDKETWTVEFSKTYQKLTQLETQKYLAPKFSAFCKPLLEIPQVRNLAQSSFRTTNSRLLSNSPEVIEEKDPFKLSKVHSPPKIMPRSSSVKKLAPNHPKPINLQISNIKSSFFRKKRSFSPNKNCFSAKRTFSSFTRSRNK